MACIMVFVASLLTMLGSPQQANPALDLQRIGKLSRVAGAPVSIPKANAAAYLPPGHPGAYAGSQIGIILPQFHADRLRVNVIRNSPFLGRLGRSIFTLAHEMGHSQDHLPFDNSAAYEGRANRYASQNFKRIAMMLGANPQRAQRLFQSSPWAQAGYGS